MRTVYRVGAAVLVVVLGGSIAACGDDDDGDDAAASTTTEAEAEPTSVEVTAVNYAFEGLPDTIAAGDTLTLTNDATDELHEMVIVAIPASEKRSAEALVQLPESELSSLFSGEPTAVILAPPGGGEQIPAVGDGTIAEPGRYLMICSIPQGADPDAYLNAPPSDGPPQVEGGPPHFTLGMFAEFTAE